MGDLTLHARIALVQLSLGSEVTTDKVGGRNNRYPSLLKALTDAVPVCCKHGITVTQPCRYYPETNTTTVQTILTDSVTGEREVSEMALDTSNGGQATGSLLTYYRRYLLLSALSLAPGGVEEDDAEFLEIKHQELQLQRKTLRSEFDRSGLSWSDVCKGVGFSTDHIPTTVQEVKRYLDFIQKADKDGRDLVTAEKPAPEPAKEKAGKSNGVITVEQQTQAKEAVLARGWEFKLAGKAAFNVVGKECMALMGCPNLKSLRAENFDEFLEVVASWEPTPEVATK